MVREAIRLGNTADGGLGSDKIFPYIYNFVSDEDDDQTFVGGIGITVPFGGSSDLSIRLRPDYNFVPRWLRLTCYFNNVGAGNFEWWDTPPTSPILYENRLSDMGQPLSAFILVRMNVYPDARFMIGGAIMNATNTNSVISIPLINGEDSGIRGIPQPYLLPATGNIQLNFTNTHASKNIIVGGCIYGWKVRL